MSVSHLARPSVSYVESVDCHRTSLRPLPIFIERTLVVSSEANETRL